jgi:hypothetical protein
MTLLLLSSSSNEPGEPGRYRIRGEEQRGDDARPRGGGGGGGPRAVEPVGSTDLLSKGGSDVF